MSRLLWFVLGGVAIAVGAGIASVMLDDESGGIPLVMRKTIRRP